MAKIQNPTLFSKYFEIDPGHIEKSGLIDPFLNVDIPLFIDPVLLEKSGINLIKTAATEQFRRHFGNFIRLLSISEQVGDVAWRGAERLLNLEEPPENGLGFGGSGRSGSSRPKDIRSKIMRTSKEIIRLGCKDPEMVSLMGFFEDGVGPDTISDFTTRVIMEPLATLTTNFCQSVGITTYRNDIVPNIHLPRYMDARGKERYVVLVPRDIVRDLPIANDWNDIELAVLQNQRIRDRFNALLARIAKPSIADKKAALREAALASSDSFEEFLGAVKEYAENYDPNADALAYYKLQKIFAKGTGGFKADIVYDLSKGPDVLQAVALDTVELFKHHVENGNLWEELWVSDKPKRERAAQLIYYAMADAFCKANNVDISPEANMGGGPIDFKFSHGYRARVLVELKRSSGTVKHGYERQLEIYKNAAQTQYGIFVIIDYGDLGKKLEQITEIRRQRLLAGERASEIVVIDATKKTSASRRLL